jgi:hypothetical protein
MKNTTMQKIIAERDRGVDQEFKSSMEGWMAMTPEERSKMRMENYTKHRDDLMTPSKLTTAYICSNAGTDLDAIEPFTTELTEIVDKMKEEMANEMPMLEGTDVPEYKQNELSDAETKECQWTTDLQNGFSTIVLTPTSIPGLSNSSCSARHNSPVLATLGSANCSCPLQTPSWQATSEDCGCVTDAMNESSECTVPMISELMPGTPSEEK